jgi:pterin-4a-carbinolamine dehydratase
VNWREPSYLRISAPRFASLTKSRTWRKRPVHHPDIDIRYNRVRLGLATHDAGGLTAKDFDLAARIDKLR